MTDHPIFVPFRGDHLAAVVTVPDEGPAAMVILLQGAGGAPHSHKYRLWTRTARELAARGLASVRMDYRGIGDSTGRYRFEMEDPPIEEIAAVARVASGAVGVNRFGLAGNCIGARAVFGVPGRLEGCLSVVSILPKSLGPVMRRRVMGAAHGSPMAAPLRRGTSRALRAVGLRSTIQFIPEVERVMSTADVLFLHGGDDHSRRRLRRGLDEARAKSRAQGRHERRAEIRVLPTDGSLGLRPIETQRAVVEEITRWMTETLTRDAPAGGAASGGDASSPGDRR